MLDQNIGTGAGAQTAFQITKTYTVGAQTRTRVIHKPISGTVLVAVGGVLQADPADYSIDETTGIITFVAAPTGEVTVGYEFYVPVRFETDSMPFNLEVFNAGGVSINLLELRL